jgi:hypothetical protein
LYQAFLRLSAAHPMTDLPPQAAIRTLQGRVIANDPKRMFSLGFIDT